MNRRAVFSMAIAMLVLASGNLAPLRNATADDRGVPLGPTGGRFSALAIDPRPPTTLYATPGPYKSTDAGATWRVNAAGPPGGTNVVAIDPSSPTIVYAGGYEGVSKSLDGGATWTPASDGLPLGNRPSGLRNVVALAVDPTTPTRLYISTFSGLYRSLNGAANWQSIGADLPYVVDALALVPTAPTTLYAATGAGVFKSPDGGDSWHVANTGMEGASVYALAVDPISPTTLYAGTHVGIFKSSDGGGLWARASTGVEDQHVVALAIDPVTPTTLYAGTFEGGAFKTVDGGGSWQPLTGVLGRYPVTALAVDPGTPARVYAALDPIGIYRSPDGGSTWSPANTGLPNLYVVAAAVDPVTPTTIYAAIGSGLSFVDILKSTDGGASWRPIFRQTSQFIIHANAVLLVLDPAVPSTVYVAVPGTGISKSIDGGETWRPANSGLSTLAVIALAIDPTVPMTVYAGVVLDPSNQSVSRVFKSADGGASWHPTPLAMDFVSTLVVAPAGTAPGFVYAAGAGLFRSLDGGASWQPISAGLPDPWVAAVATSPTDPRVVYAGLGTGIGLVGGFGVFVSTDGGDHWRPINTGLFARSIRALVVDPTEPRRVYAGTDFLGVFETEDGGETWAPIGLVGAIDDLIIVPTRPATLYTSGLYARQAVPLFPLRLSMPLNSSSFHAGDRLRADLAVTNPGPEMVVDIYVGAVLPDLLSAGLGCTGEPALAFITPAGTPVIRCWSADPRSFPRLFRSVPVPGALPPTTVADFFSGDVPADVHPGTYTLFVAFTAPDALADGVVGPLDVLATTVDFSAAP